MTPSTDILIGDAGGQHVQIRPLARTLPGLIDEADGNWIDCEVRLAAGGFTGSFRADFRSEEFHAFLVECLELGRTLDGAASFTTMEGQLAMTLTGDGKGHVRVTGDAVDGPDAVNRLQFGFELDQSCLPGLCEGLQHLLSAFPIVGATEV